MKPYLKMTHYNQPLIIPREECPVTNLSSSFYSEIGLVIVVLSNNGIRILFQMIFVYNQVFDFLRNQY